MVELTYFDQNVYFFWLTGYEIIVNIIVIFIHPLTFQNFKETKFTNALKKIHKSSNTIMNNMNFDFWHLLTWKIGVRPKMAPKCTPTSKISIANKEHFKCKINLPCWPPPPPIVQFWPPGSLTKYSDHIETFQSRAVVEMWAPPDCFVWNLSSSVAKQWKWQKVKGNS